MMQKTISLIIPCYNEQDSLPIFYRAATDVLQCLDYRYELLFVNDGSRDRTLDILIALAAEDTHVKYFSFPGILARRLPCMPDSATLMVIMWR